MRNTPPTVLITRPQAQAEGLAAELRARLGGVAVVISPVLRIVPRAFDRPAGMAGVIVTSRNAAEALGPGTGTAWCVGPGTAETALALGYQPRLAGGDAGALVEAVAKAAPEGPLLWPRGAEVRLDVAKALAARGVSVRPVVAYDQVPQPLTEEARQLLAGTGPVIAPLFSPRSAALLAAQAETARAPLFLAALSPAVAAAWTGPEPARIAIADAPDKGHMIDCIAALADSPSG